MQKTYTRNEFHNFIIYYIRDNVKKSQNLLNDNQDKSEYDEASWLYFLNKLEDKGVYSDLMSLKSRDDLKIRSDSQLMDNLIRSKNKMTLLS